MRRVGALVGLIGLILAFVALLMLVYQIAAWHDCPTNPDSAFWNCIEAKQNAHLLTWLFLGPALILLAVSKVLKGFTK